jgi:NADP-dependent 3-hydroxy acid dehydrogenase YdfG
VFGASSGIGAAAGPVRGRGAIVAAAARRSGRLEDLVREVRAAGDGEYEYKYNDFAVPGDDLARAVPQFMARLTAPGPLMDDDRIDYRMPEGQ